MITTLLIAFASIISALAAVSQMLYMRETQTRYQRQQRTQYLNTHTIYTSRCDCE